MEHISIITPSKTDDLESKMNGYHLTELGLAKRLVAKYGKDLRYSYELGKWFIWDGKRWFMDSGDKIMTLMKSIVSDLFIEAGLATDSDERKQIAKFALRCEKGSSINDGIYLAQSEPGVPIRIKDMDSDPLLLNLKNGVFDFRKLTLLEHKREFYITKLLNVDYIPDAECPEWLKTLNYATNGDKELQNYLQRVFGYTLTGDVSECGLFFFYGPTKTGKTTITGTIYDLMGSDYAKDTPLTTITVNKKAESNDDMARLAGSRMVKVSETEAHSRLATGFIKYLTGNESEITGRYLYHERFNFKPTFKFFITGNYKPIIPGDDSGAWERIHLIPFKSYVPPEKRVKRLREDVLSKEYSGILLWCINGYIELQEIGDLKKPKCVMDEVKIYQNDMDSIGQWLDECCNVNPKFKCSTDNLYNSYKEYCTRNELNYKSKTAFGTDLGNRGFQKYREGNDRGRIGVDLKGESGNEAKNEAKKQIDMDI